jgi:multidrug efflux pump subunit AcrB
MSPTLIRRALIVVILVLWAAALWLFIKTGSQAAPSKDALTYKVRAYTSSKKAATNITRLGKTLGYKSKTVKTDRVVEKYMGFTVSQDIADDLKGDKLGYIRDFLESRGYKSVVEEDREKRKKTIRLVQYFSDEESALRVAGNLKKLTTASFDVKKYSKKVTYKSFEIVFANIKDKEKAVTLQQEIKQFTPDAEIVSY